MNYYSRETTTIPVDEARVKVKFEMDKDHHILNVPWEYANKETTTVEVTNAPFKISAKSYDMLAYRTLAFTLNLTHDVITLEDASFEVTEDGFKVFIPKEHMKLRKTETVTLKKRD